MLYFFHQKAVSGVFLTFVAGTLLFFPGYAAAAQRSSDFVSVTSSKDSIEGTMGCQGLSSSDNVLCVEKVMPKKIQVGKQFDYTIKVTNLAECGVDDVVITEKILEKFAILNANPESTRSGGNTAEWALGYLGPKESKLITITGSTQDPKVTTACTKAVYHPLLCLRPEVLESDLKVTLKAPERTLICDPIPVNITVANTGKAATENVKVTLVLPQGLTLSDDKAGQTIMIGTLPGGGTSKSYDLSLKASNPGTYPHKATAEAEGGLIMTAVPSTTVVTQPVIKVSMTGPAKVLVSKDAEYKITVENAGNADAANTLITSQVPAGMKFVSASNGGVMKDGKVTWDLGVLGSQKSVNVQMLYKGEKETAAQPKVTVTGTCCQEASATVKTEVQGIPVLLFESGDSEDPIAVGGYENFHVTLENQGSAAAKNVVVKINLEKNFEYVSSKGPTVAKAENSKEIEFAPLASLEPKQKMTWEIRAKAVEEGDHLFRVKVKSDSNERPIEKTESTHVF